MKRAIMYMNQFFGQVGGEEKADYPPEIRQGAVGPGIPLSKALHAQIVQTIICGDNYMGTRGDEAIRFILEKLENASFDLFVAGPAFQAGRYGVACASICKAVQERFRVPAVTSMHPENPGVEMFRKDIFIMKGGNSALKMRKDLTAMAGFCNKLLEGTALGCAAEEGYFGRGIRHQTRPPMGAPASDRAFDMLLKKITGQPYETELPIPEPELVPIAKPIEDLSSSKIALITSGGIVPADNPDKIQSASATRWGRYDISGLKRLEKGVYKTIHAGYDPAAADEDPNVVAPLDALRRYEEEGKIGCVHHYFYSTVGTGTTQAEAQRMAREIVPHLKEDQVQAVILTST